jgi:hypothetical protein
VLSLLETKATKRKQNFLWRNLNFCLFLIMSEHDEEERKHELLALQEICDDGEVEIFVRSVQISETLGDSVKALINPGFCDDFDSNVDICGRLRICPVLNDQLKIIWTDPSSRYSADVLSFSYKIRIMSNDFFRNVLL